jgi:hypothetical protein
MFQIHILTNKECAIEVFKSHYVLLKKILQMPYTGPKPVSKVTTSDEQLKAAKYQFIA